jgi:hypothetical protein
VIGGYIRETSLNIVSWKGQTVGRAWRLVFFFKVFIFWSAGAEWRHCSHRTRKETKDKTSGSQSSFFSDVMQVICCRLVLLLISKHQVPRCQQMYALPFFFLSWSPTYIIANQIRLSRVTSVRTWYVYSACQSESKGKRCFWQVVQMFTRGETSSPYKSSGVLLVHLTSAYAYMLPRTEQKIRTYIRC